MSFCDTGTQQQSPQPLSTFATLIVTIGFFSGVILDPHHNSFKAANPGGDVYAQGRTGTWKESLMSLGVVFGMASSVLSALHAIAIKTSLVSPIHSLTLMRFVADGRL